MLREIACAALLVLPLSAAVVQVAEPGDDNADSAVASVFRLRAGSYLGIGVAEIDADRAKSLNLKEERGVEITRVEDDSPAAKAGLKVGDVVLEYNGQRVEGTEQFMRLVRETPPGREVRLAISRSGRTETLTARTGTRKREMQSFSFNMPRFDNLPEFRLPDVPSPNLAWRNPRLGIEGESVTGQLAAFFGVKEGVLVRAVTKGSAAEQAGIRAGDVITKVNGEAVASTRDITSALSSATGNKPSVPVTVVRDKKEVVLNATVGERTTSGTRAAGRTRI